MALVAGYIAWGCGFIYRSSFVVDGVRYFVLLDDEMISMRYAKNLAHGYGLVYNPGGARVEGFTNLMWVLYMALLHLLPVSLPTMSLLVQLSGLALLAVNMVVIARLGALVSGGSRRAGLAAAFLSAFYVAINNWGLQGSEVCVLTLLLSASAFMAIRCVESNSSPIPLYVLLGFTTMFRIDAFVPGLVVVGMLALVDERRRLQHLMLGTLILALFVGAQTAFNQIYYGYPFPNTYYLKLTGFPLIPRVTRGVIATYRFLMDMNPILPALALAVILLRRDWRLSLLGLMFGVILLYNVWIGADFTESPGGANRFVAIAMPLFFVLVACALDQCAAFFARTFPDFQLVEKSGAGGAMTVLTVLALITANLPTRNEALGFGFNDYYGLPLASLALVNPPTGAGMNEVGVYTALQVEKITDPDAHVMVAGAGVVPYFTDRFSIEVLGKTDPVIAHEEGKLLWPNAPKWQSFLPGHFKWDYAYAIGEQKPDLVINLLSWDEKSAQPYLRDYSRPNGTFYVLKGSPHVHVGSNLSGINVDAVRSALQANIAKFQKEHAQPKN